MSNSLAQANNNIQIVEEFYQRFFNQADVTVVDELIAENYIQHNPTLPNGRDAIKAFVAEGPFSANIKRIGSEDNLVYVQVEYPAINTAAFDIFRIENGIIQEHWDVQAAINNPLISPANGNTVFDGTNSNQKRSIQIEAKNKEIIQIFFDEFFNKGNANILDEIMTEDYIQHNYDIPNGRESIKPFVAKGAFPAEIKHMVAFKDLVFVHTFYPILNSVAVDLFRLENAKIAEHWDVVQQITPASETVSANPMF